MSTRRSSGTALLTTLVALVSVTASAPASGAERPRFDTRVLALVPFPGYPARAYVHPNGRIYAGTYESDAGASTPSRVFEFRGRGRLLRSFTIEGQTLGEPHGIQAALSDSLGRLVLLDTGPARVLILNPDTHRQRTYSTLPDLPTCSSAPAGADCSPAADDQPPKPNYAAWGPDGSLYVTDYLQAVVWRVPPGGGPPQVWLADQKLDGAEFGTTGIMLAADRSTLLIAQGSSAGGGDGDPTTGKIYSVPIGSGGGPGPITRIYESRPTDLPDGFAIARSGNLYVPMVGSPAQIAVVGPDGQELERFPQAPFTGDNGSAVPFDSPSSAMFLGTRVIIANQSAVAGDPANQAILDVEVGERGLDPLIPDGAGLFANSPSCVTRTLQDRGQRRPIGKPRRRRGACIAKFKLDRGRYRFRLRSRGKRFLAGYQRTKPNGRLKVRIRDVAPGHYTLAVTGHGGKKRRSVRVRKQL